MHAIADGVEVGAAEMLEDWFRLSVEPAQLVAGRVMS